MFQKDTHTRVSIAALFAVAKTWRPPRCLSTEEWIRKMWYLYTVECYSAIRKNETMPFAATWTDLENVMLSEVSQAEKEKHPMTPLICGIQKEMIQMNLLTKQKEIHRLRKRTCGCPGEKE